MVRSRNTSFSSYHKVAQKTSDPEVSNGIQSRFAPFKGCTYGVFAATNFCVGNVIVKRAYLLSATDHLAVFYFVQLIILLGILWFRGDHPLAIKGQRTLLVCRALLQTLGLLFLYYGVLLLPPSDANALGHSTIIITAILSTIFLKEKLNFAHGFALFLTIIGVLLISKPTILFPNNMTQFAELSNETYNSLENITLKETPVLRNFDQTLGTVVILLSATFFGSVFILTKKSCNLNIHWSTINTWPGYFGLPSSLILSIFFYGVSKFLLILAGEETSFCIYWLKTCIVKRTNDSKKLLSFNLNQKYGYTTLNDEISVVAFQIAWSALSACFKLVGVCSLNVALKHEDPTKVSIAKTSDLIISFILQAVVLSITIDLLSVIGSLLIALGTVIILAYRIYEVNYLQNTDDNNENK